jgi:hypothetical protein
MTHLNQVMPDDQVSHNKETNPCSIIDTNQINKILYSKNKEICNAFGCSNIAKYSTVLTAGSTVLHIAVCKKCLSKFGEK